MGTWIFQIYRWNKFYTLAKSRYWFLRLIHAEFLRHVAWSPEGNWAVWWITLRKRCQSHISSCKIAAKPIWSIEMFSDITSSQAMLLFKRNPQLTVFFSPNMSSTQESSFNSSPSPSVDRNNLTIGFRIPSWYCWCFRKIPFPTTWNGYC